MATTKKAPAKKKVATKKAVKKAVKKAAGKKITIKKNDAPKVEPQIGLGEKGAIHMRVLFNDQEFEGNTDDIAATVRSMAPARINTKTIMQFSLAGVENGKVVEKVLMVMNARRIFSNDMSAMILAKGVTLALGYNGE